jgi:hypothetical protein
MMRVRLTGAGDTKIFDVVSAVLKTTSGELTLTCRDGQVCLALVGAWEMAVTPSSLAPMSCDEIERLHEGRLVVMAN